LLSSNRKLTQANLLIFKPALLGCALLLFDRPDAPSDQHRGIDHGIGRFNGHGMVNLVSAWNGSDDAAHDDLLRGGFLGECIT
jgi:hypothetical protein